MLKFGYKSSTPNPGYKGQTLHTNVKGTGRVFDYIRNQIKKWQVVSFFLGATMLFAICGLIYLGSRPKTVPLVVTVQPWGEAQYVGDISDYSYNKIPVSAVSMEYYLRDFVKSIHAISSDEDIVIQNWQKAFQFISPKGYKQLEAYYNNSDPLTSVGKMKTYVEIETILKVTDNTYQVDWRELNTAMDNSPLKMTGKRGLFTTALATPDKKIQHINPLGIFITEFDIEEKGDIR